MDPPRPHVLVEGEGVRGCPQLTTQPIFPEVDYGGDSPLGMPYAGTVSIETFLQLD